MDKAKKKYLKGYQKVSYASGDLASTLVVNFIGMFVLLYATNAVGMNAGIIGMLILIARIFDGVSDLVFGYIIDRFRLPSKLGKVRPWMFYAEIGVAVTLIMLFSIPEGNTSNMMYAYFFLVYIALNAIFYTANNVAYSSLTSRITLNPDERVQMGSYRFIFNVAASILLSFIITPMVSAFGGGVQGWRMTAIVISVIALIVNSISCLSVKELSEEELAISDASEEEQKKQEKLPISTAIKAIFTNHYIILFFFIYALINLYINTQNTVAVYYTTYVLGNESLLGLFTMTSALPMLIALLIVPALVKKMGIYKVNLFGYGLAGISGIFCIVANAIGNIPMLLLFKAITGLTSAPFVGTSYAIIAEISGYTIRKDKIRVDSVMFSFSTMGVKIGSGLAVAITGLLLEMAHYDGTAATQVPSAVSMISNLYIVIPAVINILILVLLYFMNPMKANEKWDKEHNNI